MGWFDKLKEDVNADQQQSEAGVQASLQPGDTSTPADTFRNKAISTLGMPNEWQTTVADQKRQDAQPKPVTANGALATLAAPPELEAVGAAEGLAPGLKALAQQIQANPNMPLEVMGGMNLQKFQKLRDALGHVGPIIMKGMK